MGQVLFQLDDASAGLRYSVCSRPWGPSGGQYHLTVRFVGSSGRKIEEISMWRGLWEFNPYSLEASWSPSLY